MSKTYKLLAEKYNQMYKEDEQIGLNLPEEPEPEDRYEQQDEIEFAPQFDPDNSLTYKKLKDLPVDRILEIVKRCRDAAMRGDEDERVAFRRKYQLAGFKGHWNKDTSFSVKLRQVNDALRKENKKRHRDLTPRDIQMYTPVWKLAEKYELVLENEQLDMDMPDTHTAADQILPAVSQLVDRSDDEIWEIFKSNRDRVFDQYKNMDRGHADATEHWHSIIVPWAVKARKENPEFVKRLGDIIRANRRFEPQVPSSHIPLDNEFTRDLEYKKQRDSHTRKYGRHTNAQSGPQSGWTERGFKLHPQRYAQI